MSISDSEKIDFLNLYVDKIIHYLTSDIKGYFKAEDNGIDIGCVPYLLSASSGIDFLGSLSIPFSQLGPNVQPGLNGKSTKGSPYFIKEFMGQVDTVYCANGIPEFIYKVVRCGQVHEAIVKVGVLTGKKYGRDYHLKQLSISQGSVYSGQSKDFVYLNASVFAEDFILSLPYFKSLMGDRSRATEMADRLLDYFNSLGSMVPGFPSSSKIEIDDKICEELYERGSSSPFDSAGSTTLRNDFWTFFID